MTNATRRISHRDTLCLPTRHVKLPILTCFVCSLIIRQFQNLHTEVWGVADFVKNFWKVYIFRRQGGGAFLLFSVLESMFWGKKGGISHKMFSISAPEVARQPEKVRTLGRMCIKNTLPFSKTRIIYQKSSRSPHQWHVTRVIVVRNVPNLRTPRQKSRPSAG